MPRPPFRIAIDLEPLCRPLSGVGIYLKHLLPELLAISAAEWVYPVVSSNPWHAGRLASAVRHHIPAGRVGVERCWLPGGELVRSLLPARLTSRRLNCYHMAGLAQWLRPGKLPVVVTAHDLAWLRLAPEIYPRPPYADLARLPARLRAADIVLSVSAATRGDLIELAGVREDRIVVTPLAARPQFRPPAAESDRHKARQQLSGGRPYFLSVGTIEPRKNLVRLVEAFAIARRRGCRHRLVLAGFKHRGLEAVQQAIARTNMERHVDLPGYVDDDVLLRYLWGADALVMVSLYEGFGLPAIEALACGTRVIASRAGALPEVVGDAGLLVEPLEVDSIAGALEQVAESAGQSAIWRSRGAEQASRFNWPTTARLTWEAYERLGA